MAIESVFPIENNVFKIFFIDPAGPVLILKQEDQEGYYVQLVFSYLDIRTDMKLRFHSKSTKEEVRDDDEAAEERRDLAFENMGQTYIEKVIKDAVRTLYGVTEDKEGDDDSKHIEALPEVPQ